jgi:hypothetical protein
MRIPNKRVACTPFTDVGVKAVAVSKGVVGMEQKLALTALKVVYPDTEDTYRAGDTVYVLGECVKDDWGKKVYDLGGEKVILVPLEQVYATDAAGPNELVAGLSLSTHAPIIKVGDDDLLLFTVGWDGDLDSEQLKRANEYVQSRLRAVGSRAQVAFVGAPALPTVVKRVEA